MFQWTMKQEDFKFFYVQQQQKRVFLHLLTIKYQSHAFFSMSAYSRHVVFSNLWSFVMNFVIYLLKIYLFIEKFVTFFHEDLSNGSRGKNVSATNQSVIFSISLILHANKQNWHIYWHLWWLAVLLLACLNTKKSIFNVIGQVLKHFSG